MFRRNRLWGLGAVVFGAGLLLGMWIEGSFFSHCIAFGLVFWGLAQYCKK